MLSRKPYLPRAAFARFGLAVALLLFTGKAFGYTGPATAVNNLSEFTANINGGGTISSDGTMAQGSGKNLQFSFQLKGNSPAVVYWGPTLLQLSLDNGTFSGSETMSFSSINGNTATWVGSTLMYALFSGGFSSVGANTALTLNFSSSDPNNPPNLRSGVSGLPGGAFLLMAPGVTYTVNVLFQAIAPALGGPYRAAYDLANANNNPQYGMAYTFNYGFFYDRAPSNITLSPSNINENNAVGAVVGALNATDYDSIGNPTFALVGGPDQSSFSISGANLIAQRSFDFEAKSQYSISVRATDSAGNQTTRALTITINDLEEPPFVKVPVPTQTRLEGFKDTFKWDLNTVFGDQDAKDKILRYSVSVKPAGAVSASIDPTSYNTLLVSSVQYSNGPVIITLTATDTSNVSTSSPFTFNITPVNDPPQIVANLSSDANTVTKLEDFGSATVDVSKGFWDPDGPFPLKYTITGLATDPALKNPSTNLIVRGGNPGQLLLTSAPNWNGTYYIGVTASDTQYTTVPNIQKIIITPVNDQPSFGFAQASYTVLENAGSVRVPNFGINLNPGGGPDELPQTNNFTFAVLSNSNPTLIPGIQMDLLGNLNFTVGTYQSGTAAISFQLNDHGGTANGGVELSVPRTFNLVVLPVNQPPTLDAIPTFVTNENPDTQLVPVTNRIALTGISPGPNEAAQKLTLNASASSQNGPLILTNFNIAYQPGAATGLLTFISQPYRSGTNRVQLSISDDGGTANGGLNVTNVSFEVRVNPVDHPPFGVPNVPAPQVTSENTAITVSLNGAFQDLDGDAFNTLQVSVSNPSILTAPYSVANLSRDDNGLIASMTLTPQPYAYTRVGTGPDNPVIVTMVASANGKAATNTFPVTINEVNFPPTMAPLTNLFLNQDIPSVVVPLTGLSPGPNEVGIDFIATNSFKFISSAPAVIPASTMFVSNLNTNAGTASLTFFPTPLQTGSVSLTIILSDARGASITNAFNVQLKHINHAPSLNSVLPLVLRTNMVFTGTNIAIQVLNGVTNYFTNVVTLTNAAIVVLEDQPPLTIGLTNLFKDIDGDTVYNSVFANTNNALVQIAPVDPAGDNFSLQFTPDGNGKSDVTIRGTDTYLDGYFTFSIVVLPVNDPPFADRIPAQSVPEDSGLHPLAITGLQPGPANEADQTITNIWAVILPGSSNLIASAQIAYTNGLSSALLTYTTVTNANGQGFIRLFFQDNGGTNLGGLNTSYQDVLVTVNPVIDEPVLVKPFGTLTVLEDQFATNNYQTVLDLSGAYEDRDHPGALVDLAIDAGGIVDPSNVLNRQLFGAVGLDPNNHQKLILTFLPNGNGTAQISYHGLTSGVLASQGDTVTIQVIPVNDPPVVRPIPAQVVNEDSGPFALPLTFSPGPPNESSQSIFSISAAYLSSTSSNLVQNLSVDYLHGQTNAVLHYSLAQNQSGEGVIQLIFKDDGGTANGGIDTTVVTFPITVQAQNDPPTLVRPVTQLNFLEDQFASANNVTSVDLTGAYTDVDDAYILLSVLQIVDPSSILDTRNAAVAIDKSHGQLLNLKFMPGAFGQAQIQLAAASNGSLSESNHLVMITVSNVNSAPTCNPIPNQNVSFGGVPSAISITGIGVGPNESAIQRIKSVTATVVTQTPADLISGTPQVNYRTNSNIATLSYAITPGRSGTARLRVTVQDDGGTANGGQDTSNQDFLVTVADPIPTPVLVSPIGTITFREEILAAQPLQPIDLSGVYSNSTPNPITLLLGQISDPASILSAGTLSFDPANPFKLLVTFNTNAFGTARITYRAIANQVLSTNFDTLTLIVLPFNNAPTIDPILRQVVPMNSGPYALNITGITPGPNEVGAITLNTEIRSQSPTNLLSSYSLKYDGTNSIAVFQYALNTNVSGLASIRITATDPEGASSFRDFRIQVVPANTPPYFVAQPSPITFLEDQFATNGYRTTIDLSGVFADVEGDSITLLVTNLNDPSGIFAQGLGGISLNPVNKQQLVLTFNPGRFGNASLIFSAVAGGLQATNSATLNINVLPVNDPPTLDPIANQTVPEDSGPVSITLTGITPGPTNEIQNIKSITAYLTNATAALLASNPLILYSSNATTATLQFQVASNAVGTGLIHVTVQDDGGTANGGIDSFSRDFILTVTQVDDPPRLNPAFAVVSRTLTDTNLAALTNLFLFDLTGAFTDADNDPIALIPGAAADPDNILGDEIPGGIIATSTNGLVLAVSFTPGAYGRAQIPLRALANGVFSDDSMLLNIALTPPNGAPSMNLIPDVTVTAGSGLQTVAIRGIRPGSPAAGASNVVSVTAQVLSQTTNNLVNQLSVNYKPGDPSGSVQFVPNTFSQGSAVIRLTATDDGNTANGRSNTFNRDFSVIVTKASNPPVLATNAIPDQVFLEDQFLNAGGQTFIDLTGVFIDPDGDPLSLRIRQISDPQNVLDDERGNVAVDPFNPQRIRVVFLKNAFGVASIQVAAFANGASSSDTITFNIRVTPVNNPPILDPIATQLITQNKSAFAIPLTGISYGPTNENQTIIAVRAALTPQSPTNVVQSFQVNYTSNAPNGTLLVTLNPSIVTASVGVNLSVQDSGGTANGGIDTTTRSFTLNVNIAQNPPQLVAPKGTVTYLEDAFVGQGNVTSVNLTGVFTQTEGQPIQLVLGAIDDPQNILNDETPGVIQFAPSAPFTLNLGIVPDSFGTAHISYRALSQGIFSTNSDTLTIVVTPVNDPPSFDPIPTQSAAQGSPAQSFFITGLNVGPGEAATQVISNITVSVLSQTPSNLLAGPVTVSFTNGFSARASYSLNPAQFGTATLLVSVQDTGGTANGGRDTTTQAVQLVVAKVPHPPVLAATLPPGARPQLFLEDQFAQSGYRTTLDLTGLFTDPDGDPLTYLVGAITDPNDMLDNESGGVQFDPANPQKLQLLFRPNGFGVATIPVYALADGLFSPTNLISITVTNVNDPPTLNVISNQTVLANSSTNQVSVSGLGVGPGERDIQQISSVTVQVASQSTNLISGTPVFVQGSSPSLGRIVYVLVPGATGTATLNVVVKDNGGTNNGGIDTFTRSFSVTVNPPPSVDHPPALVQPFGRTNLLLSAVRQLPQAQLTLNLTNRFIDPDGDPVTLFILSVTDTNNILNNEISGGVQFTSAQTLLVTFNTNSTGSAQINYLAIAKGQLSTNSDTIAINVATNTSGFPAGAISKPDLLIAQPLAATVLAASLENSGALLLEVIQSSASIVEVSSDLAHWQSLDIPPISTTQEAGIQILRYRIPAATDRQFFRVRKAL